MSEKAKIANKPKNKGGNPEWQKGMKSPNPTGRPKDGESWAAVIKEVSNMNTDDILALVGKNNDLGKAMAQMPKNVQMKYLVVARVMAQLMFEPQSSLWNSLMERVEGKVAQPITGDSTAPLRIEVIYVDNQNTITETSSGAVTDKSAEEKA